ncbi:MAG: transcriptional repressor, partial [Sphingobacteriales bacterium]
VICTECHKVIEFCDPRIHQIQTMVGELLNFKVLHHSLNLYGICGDCRANTQPAQP